MQHFFIRGLNFWESAFAVDRIPVQLLCAPEGIRTPNLLIRSFALRLSKRVSKFLLLRSFAFFKGKSVLFVSSDLLRYLYGWKQIESKTSKSLALKYFKE